MKKIILLFVLAAWFANGVFAESFANFSARYCQSFLSNNYDDSLYLERGHMAAIGVDYYSGNEIGVLLNGAVGSVMATHVTIAGRSNDYVIDIRSYPLYMEAGIGFAGKARLGAMEALGSIGVNANFGDGNPPELPSADHDPYTYNEAGPSASALLIYNINEKIGISASFRYTYNVFYMITLGNIWGRDDRAYSFSGGIGLVLKLL